MLIEIITISILGCAIGSFLTVCIYRMPFACLAAEELLEEEKEAEQHAFPTTPPAPFEKLSVSHPKRSFCTKCHKQIVWWQNIPVISWMILGGKCANCKVSISCRYPIIELITAISAILCWKLFGANPPTAILIFAFTCAMIVISVIDYDYYIIPNSISIYGTILGLAVSGVNQFFHVFQSPVVFGFVDSFLGMISGAGFLFIVSEFYLRVRKIEGLGMGDVKLLAMIGAFFGVECSLYTIFIGSVIGAVSGITLILIKGRKMSQPLPFGPFLALAALVYVYSAPNSIEETADIIRNILVW
jgi:leader peptidase (prepilin peptidase) / N-methyltransferase